MLPASYSVFSGGGFCRVCFWLVAPVFCGGLVRVGCLGFDVGFSLRLLAGVGILMGRW